MVVTPPTPTTLHPFVPGETQVADLEDQLRDHDDMLQLLRTNLLKAQSRMKAQADSKRRELSFREGEDVFLRIQPFRHTRSLREGMRSFLLVIIVLILSFILWDL